MSTLQRVELGVLGPLQVRRGGVPVSIPGAKPRAILTMLGLHGGSVVSADTLLELLWGNDPPRTAAKALQTHISSLRRTLGDGFVLTEGTGWILSPSETDASRYRAVTRKARDAAAAGDTGQAVARFEEALTLWRGIPELPDTRRGISEKTRWIEGHAALVEDRADALLSTGRAAEVIGELEAAVADAPLRERRWGQLMLALYRAGRQGEALAAYQRARSLLADELGVDPGPELRRLEAAVVAQDPGLETPVTQQLPAVMRAVTFLLTDIEGSTAAWEANAEAMALALARHDELVEQVITSRAGRLIKTRGEGDATFSVFDRPSGAAAAAMELQDAIVHEPWALLEPMRIRVALHTGEAEFRDGDYFGRAVNRAARLRSLAAGGQILCSGATAELVIDALPDDVVLTDLGMRHLKNLARPEHVFELRLDTATREEAPATSDVPLDRPALPAVLIGPGPFVGRGSELERLLSAWQATLAAGARTIFIAGEPGVGKTRLAGEWSQRAYEQGAIVLYGRCDEDLGAPYQPFAEALRALMPCISERRLRGLRGIEALLPLAPGLTDTLPDLASAARADPDTERYALFDAVVTLLELASASAPMVLILDDLHWAAKPTLLLLRHLLRFGDRARVQIVGTYRSTDLDRSHPLAAMLADLHRDGTADRLALGGLDEGDVTAYVAEAGYDDEELANALASVTGGNPFFLIEALRHVDESGGVWDPSTLPQGVREAVSRRLSRLPAETNKALAAAAVVGSRFALDLVEHVVGTDLIDAFDEASKAGIVIEEPGGHYRFNHALVRQSLLAELASVRRMRLHQRIATTLETQPGAGDELLAELAHHYFECAWAGNAAKAVEYCRRAADQAMARLAYEGAADFFDRALHALEEIDNELPDRDEQAAELLIARCEALLAAGDVASATGAVSQLQSASVDSARLAAWAACFDGQLSMLIHPEQLDEAETAVGAAAAKLAELDDAAGEAKAHTVHATCLARLGRIADCEVALDDALTAARRARDHGRVNAVLANAPLAALWGPNPVPRAGGRCLDVVRLLRITTDSPAVEATSTRCQAVLEAFRGRAAAARRMIDSARRAVTELGLRHSLLEVEQFAGIVELIADDPAAAEPHLRKAYTGFRRMGLDADTAETAALLGRACLTLEREAEADELCTESERLAGHALKASIAWRTLRARLLSIANDHGEARRVAEAAVALAERTDALVDHGDACLTLAMVLERAGDASGARAAAERAVGLYERKGAAALAEKAQLILGERVEPTSPAPPEVPAIELDNEAVRVGERVMAALHREAWDELERLFAPDASIESRRKIVGLALPSAAVRREARRGLETGAVRIDHVMIAARGERLALSRLMMGTADATPGAPHDEFLQLYGIDEEGRVALQIWFDVDDIDAAMAELEALHARFEEERPRTRRLENAATRVFEKEWSHYAARDWDALAETVADCYSGIDHRRVVNAENQHGRDAVVKDLQVAADVGFTISMVGVIAIRGEYLALTRVRAAGRDPEAIQNDALNVVEIDADERILAAVTFDLEYIDAAFAELDARYLAGEAAPYAHTWSVIAGAYAALNRHEIAATTPDFASIDHRRGTTFAPGDLIAYVRATWDLAQDGSTYIEAVHRLNNLGAVVTHLTYGSSPEGFDAEWREVFLITAEGDLLSRCELFDEAGLDAALARFEQLSRPAPRLENAASQVAERFLLYFASCKWDAMAQLQADDISTDDRRRVVNAGIRRGRAAAVQDARANADVGAMKVASAVIATRGERLVLCRARYSGSAEPPETFHVDTLSIYEINADGQIAAVVTFDPDDFDAAIAELDARYLAGEAAAHAHAWSVIAGGFAALRRSELPLTTPECVSIDHRRTAAFAPGELNAYTRAAFELTADHQIYVEAVHDLNDAGAVCTHVTHGVSHEGFDAEWREVAFLGVEGDAVNRCEIFDEADLDAALARFDELSQPARRVENAASQVTERFLACFATGEWDAMPGILADNFGYDDRRRVVGAGVRGGRNTYIADMRAAADLWAANVPTVMATRGERLALARLRFSGRDQEPEAFVTDVLGIAEINTDERIVAVVSFDPNDFDSAIAELDARYLAGEAAPYARTWAVVSGSYAALNRRELPSTTPDCVNVDHRHEAAFGPGDLTAYIEAGWDFEQDIKIYIEQVHGLSDTGAVVTYAAQETSREGLDAEWRGIAVFTVEGDTISRTEVFDEAELDAALTRFDELHPQKQRLENAASRADDRFFAHARARNWAAMAEILADNSSVEDRRHVVNIGVWKGRDVLIANFRALGEAVADATSTPIAIRGEHLTLSRICAPNRDLQQGDFSVEMLGIAQLDTDNRIAAHVLFDPGDIDAAFEELDARYLAGEAAAHAQTWSVVAKSYASINRDEFSATTADFISLDHRRTAAFAPGDVIAYFDAGRDLDQHISTYVEAVHRLSNLGAVITFAGHGTSREGFDAEWRGLEICTVDGQAFGRVELFEEEDLDAAIAKFEQLSHPVPRLENTAVEVSAQFLRHFAARDWVAIAEKLSEDYLVDDRRRTVNAGVRRGRDDGVKDWQAAADVGFTTGTFSVVATRGRRLALTRARYSRCDQRPEAFEAETVHIVETDTNGKMTAAFVFDPDDIDAAFAELDARYLAGEAATHSRIWSVVMQAQASWNRHEVFPSTKDWVNLDHRRGRAFAPGELIPFLRATWNVAPDVKLQNEAVHRLSELGTVVTVVAMGTSHEGFEAEWREIGLLTFDGNQISRCELFDEADLEAALARFEELHTPARRLENSASQAGERFLALFAANEWGQMAEMLAEDFSNDDRRQVVGAGVQHGRDAQIADMRTVAELWTTNVTPSVIATRGGRLALMRLQFSDRDHGSEAFLTEVLGVIEINADERIAAVVFVEPDKIDAAFEELDARYLAGEAAAEAQTWYLVADACSAMNRHELPATTQDCVNIDHRRGLAFAPGDVTEYIRAVVEITPDFGHHIEVVHQLSNRAAVATYMAHGTSQDGFAAEWRVINVLIFEGNAISRLEMFDEEDLPTALARFAELQPK